MASVEDDILAKEEEIAHQEDLLPVEWQPEHTSVVADYSKGAPQRGRAQRRVQRASEGTGEVVWGLSRRHLGQGTDRV